MYRCNSTNTTDDAAYSRLHTNPAIGSGLDSGHHRRGVGEPERSLPREQATRRPVKTV